jgi:uncharacterized RDD family membrane protein YckC
VAIPPTTTLTSGLLADGQRMRVIAGFWRRLIAFGIDSLLIGAVGAVLGVFFSSFFQSLGSWGPLLGFAIALPYFGLLNSSIGHGQTLGKRLMQIRVVDKDGQPISTLDSFARYAILGSPWFLSTNMLPSSFGESWIGSEVGVFLGALQVIVIYLYVFNRHTRQSLHDLVVGTYVVESVTFGAVEAPLVWKGHVYVAAALALALLVVVPLAAPHMMRLGPFPELITIQHAAQQFDNVGKVSTAITKSAGTERSTTLTVTVNWKRQPLNEEMEAQKIAVLVLAADRQASNRSSLQIRTVNGYDIGIAHVLKYHSFEFTPDQWFEKIRDASPTQRVGGQ